MRRELLDPCSGEGFRDIVFCSRPVFAKDDVADKSEEQRIKCEEQWIIDRAIRLNTRRWATVLFDLPSEGGTIVVGCNAAWVEPRAGRNPASCECEQDSCWKERNDQTGRRKECLPRLAANQQRCRHA